jgi:hypothetical protein
VQHTTAVSARDLRDLDSIQGRPDRNGGNGDSVFPDHDLAETVQSHLQSLLLHVGR